MCVIAWVNVFVCPCLYLFLYVWVSSSVFPIFSLYYLSSRLTLFFRFVYTCVLICICLCVFRIELHMFVSLSMCRYVYVCFRLYLCIDLYDSDCVYLCVLYVLRLCTSTYLWTFVYLTVCLCLRQICLRVSLNGGFSIHFRFDVYPSLHWFEYLYANHFVGVVYLSISTSPLIYLHVNVFVILLVCIVLYMSTCVC